MEKSEQLVLPTELESAREIFWLHAEKVEMKRRFRSSRTIVKLLMDEATGNPATSSIQAAEIPKIQDPDLRYALRLEDAANAMGWNEVTASLQTRHFVTVEATDEGFNSRLISATYSGIKRNGTDTFMRDLYRAQPTIDVPGITSIRVTNSANDPDTHYWVRQAEADKTLIISDNAGDFNQL